MIRHSVLLSSLIVFSSGVSATDADDEQPSLDFLEYLGQWEESDEEWVVVDWQAKKEEPDPGKDERKDDEQDS